MRRIPHPTALVRERMEPVHVRAGFPVGTIFDNVPMRREAAPQPVPQSQFDGVGKDYTSRMNRPVQNLAIAEWLGVMAWPFQLIKVPGAMRVPIAPHQAMNPFAERVNVDMAPQTSLGATTAIKAPLTWAAPYAKLGVWR